MRGTNIFGVIGKSIFESAAGRIRWRSNMWAIVGSRWDKRRLQNDRLIGSSRVNAAGEFEVDGRTLVGKPCTLCPKAPGDDFYFDGKWSWVPAIECRKCEYHRASNRSFRFPRCTYKRPQDASGVAAEALVQIGDLINKATTAADEITGHTLLRDTAIQEGQDGKA